MDAITLRWIVIGEATVAVLFGALVLRPDAWLYWRPLVLAGLGAFIVVPLAIGTYLVHEDRKLRSSNSSRQVERT